MKNIYKNANEIIVGDKIIDNENNVLTISGVFNGVIWGSTLLIHEKGFSNVLNANKIQIQNQLEPQS